MHVEVAHEKLPLTAPPDHINIRVLLLNINARSVHSNSKSRAEQDLCGFFVAFMDRH